LRTWSRDAASALVELVLDTRKGLVVASRIRGHDLRAPAHLGVEVVGAIRRSIQREMLFDREAEMAFRHITTLSLSLWAVMLLMDRAWSLRRSHSAADALYVALAEGTGAPLITRDLRLGRSTQHTASIEAI
jgi:predicted nucleic acid-binding protein